MTLRLPWVGVSCFANEILNRVSIREFFGILLSSSRAQGLIDHTIKTTCKVVARDENTVTIRARDLPHAVKRLPRPFERQRTHQAFPSLHVGRNP